jgi:hypothetical protein
VASGPTLGRLAPIEFVELYERIALSSVKELLYFNPDSPVELANLMMTMLDDPEARQNLIDKATLVVSKWSIKGKSCQFSGTV